MPLNGIKQFSEQSQWSIKFNAEMWRTEIICETVLGCKVHVTLMYLEEIWCNTQVFELIIMSKCKSQIA